MRWNALQAHAFLAWLLPRHAGIGGRTEIRALGRGPRGGVWSAFVGPDDIEAVLESLAPLPGSPRPVFPDWPRSGEANLYFSLNPVRPEEVPERGSTLFSRVSRATRDRDVLAYSMLAIDVDPERIPHDRAATDGEKAEALAVATAIRAELCAAGVAPLVADSGNGYHLLVPLIPVFGDAVSGAAREARGILRALDGRFSTKGARVDTSVYNPSRILKLYGSLAMKGTSTAETPHRLASIDLGRVPDDVDVVARLAERAGYRTRLTTASVSPSKSAPNSRSLVTAPATPWSDWRARALAALPLDAVYGELLTGKVVNGWLQCRDPGSASGDQRPSAGVADVGADAERGAFHSFRDGRTLSAFDFLMERGVVSDFRSACAHVASLSGVALPGACVVGEGALHRLRAIWEATADESRRNAAVREALSSAIPLPAIEQRHALDAVADATGLSATVLQRSLGELRRADRKTTARARIEAAVPRGRVVVDYVQNRDTVEALFDALLAAVKPVNRFFRQGREVVFVRRGVGPCLVHERNIAGILSALIEIRFLHEHDDGQELVRYDVLPTDLSRAFVNSPRVAAGLPELLGYARTPLFDAAGHLVNRPGFDADSGIFYDGALIAPASGTALLDEALAGVHWKEDTDQTNFVGAMLTTLTMPMWSRGHPFVAINGNKAGVGKSTLARVLALVAEGSDEISTVSWCPDEAEFEKQLATRVEAGDRIIIVDNAKTQKPIESAILERCITDTRLNFRRLGSNTAITRPRNDVLFCLTMNLVQMGGDLRRRALPVNLSTDRDVRSTDYPIDDVLGWILAQRVAIVAELLGLVQRWIDADRPLADVPARHSTGQRWAATIDGILTHAGRPGFLSNFEASERAFDPKYAVMLEIVRAHRKQAPLTPGEWAEVLVTALADRFRDRHGEPRSERARATIVGALFTDCLDARFELDGETWRLSRAWPEGTGRSAVYQFVPCAAESGVPRVAAEEAALP